MGPPADQFRQVTARGSELPVPGIADVRIDAEALDGCSYDIWIEALILGQRRQSGYDDMISIGFEEATE